MTVTSEPLLRAQTSKGSRGFESHPLRHFLGFPGVPLSPDHAISCSIKREQNAIARPSPYKIRTAGSRVVRGRNPAHVSAKIGE